MRAILMLERSRWVDINWPTLNHVAKNSDSQTYLAIFHLAIHIGRRDIPQPLNPVFRSTAPQTPPTSITLFVDRPRRSLSRRMLTSFRMMLRPASSGGGVPAPGGS